VHEGAKTCGVGAEIMALLMEHALADLVAPVARVTGYDVVMPYFQLEKQYIPSVDRIKVAVRNVMEN
jgi:pyruvate dehydrogenase E1 component beta subunit